MNAKELCKYYAKIISPEFKEEKEIFIGMYNCLNDISSINIETYHTIIKKCEKLISENQNFLSDDIINALTKSKDELKNIMRQMD